MALRTDLEARCRLREVIQSTVAMAGLERVAGYTGTGDPIAASLGIRIVEQPLPAGEEGQYIPSDPPVIVLDSTVSDPGRLSFTFFHEVTHHLVREDPELLSFIHELSAARDKDFRMALESYCNAGAAEFLIPAADVQAVIRDQGFTIKLVEQLEPVYPASKPATTSQLAQCATHECFLLVCAEGQIPGETPPQASYTPASVKGDRLHSQYAFSSPSSRYPIGRFVPVPADHPIADAYVTKGYVTGNGPILFKSGNRRWRCECEAFFYKGKVYAAFNVTPPTSPEQLPLF
jgi:hypothetical protein